MNMKKCFIIGAAMLTATLYAGNTKIPGDAEKKVWIEPVTPPLQTVKFVDKVKAFKIVETRTIKTNTKAVAVSKTIALLKLALKTSREIKNKDFDHRIFKDEIDDMMQNLKSFE